jgi:hypothetical protein
MSTDGATRRRQQLLKHTAGRPTMVTMNRRSRTAVKHFLQKGNVQPFGAAQTP